MSLPDLLATITVWKNAALKLASDLRKAAAAPNITPELRDLLLVQATEAEAAANSAAVNTITDIALGELGAAIKSGKSIIQHHPTEFFGG